MNETISSTVDIIQELQIITNTFANLEIYTISGLDINGTIQQAINKGDDLYDNAVKLRDTLLANFNSKRESVMIAAFLISVLLLLMVAVGSIINSGKLSFG